MRIQRLTLPALAIVVGLAGVGCGSSSSPSRQATPATKSKTVSPGTWTGFGAPLSDFAADHPKAPISPPICPSTAPCYGSPVTSGGQSTWEFTQLTTDTDNGRVDGFTYNFPAGTSITAAQDEVYSLLPADAKQVAFKVQRGNGGCATWGITSKRVARWLGGGTEGDTGGDVIVTVGTGALGADSSYDSNNISNAVVSIGSISVAMSAGC